MKFIYVAWKLFYCEKSSYLCIFYKYVLYFDIDIYPNLCICPEMTLAYDFVSRIYWQYWLTEEKATKF